MKLKLIDVQMDGHEAETGTCDFCMGTMWVDEPVFIFEKENGERVEVDGYYWSWGDYSEPWDMDEIDNVIEFAAWLSGIDFKENVELDYAFVNTMVTNYANRNESVDEEYPQYDDRYELKSEKPMKKGRRYSEAEWGDETV